MAAASSWQRPQAQVTHGTRCALPGRPVLASNALRSPQGSKSRRLAAGNTLSPAAIHARRAYGTCTALAASKGRPDSHILRAEDATLTLSPPSPLAQACVAVAPKPPCSL